MVQSVNGSARVTNGSTGGPVRCVNCGYVPLGLTRDNWTHMILEEVAVKHGVGVEELSAPGRRKYQVVARVEAAQRLRGELMMELKEIGLLLGGRDHATVRHMLTTNPHICCSCVGKIHDGPQVKVVE